MTKAIMKIGLICSALALVASGGDVEAQMHRHGITGNACRMIPPNNHSFAPGQGGGITEQMFNRIIEATEKIYAPIIAAKGGRLVIERRWKDPTVNAFARRDGNIWHVAMFGGLARHPEATPDAFAMVLCHELGHHLGGTPKYSGNDWASVEGQSDYYASLKCMRTVLEKVDNWESLRRLVRSASEIPAVVDERCKAGQGGSRQEYAICVRSALGGAALARLLADLNGSPVPKFETPDTTQARTTQQSHPKAQCRLDTYFAGAICPVSHKTDVDDKDPKVGTCNETEVAGFSRPRSRGEAMNQAATAAGVRPRCWYNPRSVDGDQPEEGFRRPIARR